MIMNNQELEENETAVGLITVWCLDTNVTIELQLFFIVSFINH